MSTPNCWCDEPHATITPETIHVVRNGAYRIASRGDPDVDSLCGWGMSRDAAIRDLTEREEMRDER